jgi:hypothetical protein
VIQTIVQGVFRISYWHFLVQMLVLMTYSRRVSTHRTLEFDESRHSDHSAMSVHRFMDGKESDNSQWDQCSESKRAKDNHAMRKKRVHKQHH